MAEPIFTLSGRADGTVNIPQYYGVAKTGTSDWYAAATVAGQKIDGLVQAKVTDAEQAVTVQRLGVSKCIAGGAFSIGDPLNVDSVGRLKEAVGVYQTALSGSNNDLLWTTLDAYRDKPVAIQYLDHGGTTFTGYISVEGYTITVHLSRSGSAISETGDSIKTLLAAHSLASLMVSAVDAAANDGSGAVTALDTTRLAGNSNIIAEALHAASGAGSEVDVLLKEVYN